MKKLFLLSCLLAPAALAAPGLESITASPNPAKFAGDKAPEVQVTVTVKRPKTGPGNCEASVDFGDGARPRPEDFGMSSARSFHHTYAKNGTYTVSAKGTGKTPCEGVVQAALSVTGQPAAKKAESKKTEPKKKAEPKKKSAPKKKGAEAPSSRDAAKP